MLHTQHNSARICNEYLIQKLLQMVQRRFMKNAFLRITKYSKTLSMRIQIFGIRFLGNLFSIAKNEAMTKG